MRQNHIAYPADDLFGQRAFVAVAFTNGAESQDRVWFAMSLDQPVNGSDTGGLERTWRLGTGRDGLDAETPEKLRRSTSRTAVRASGRCE